MLKSEVLFDGNLIYVNGLVIERGKFDYYVTNSDEDVLLEWVSIEEAVKFCLEQ
jgi:hypothetical protein